MDRQSEHPPWLPLAESALRRPAAPVVGRLKEISDQLAAERHQLADN